MNHKTFTTGQLAKQANCKVETVHYYEKTGIMPEPGEPKAGTGFIH